MKVFIFILFICASVHAEELSEEISKRINSAKSKVATCMACHGANGISAIPGTPHLRGQQAVYLAEQLKAYRDGTRVDPNKIMSAMAQALSDEDILDIAAYYENMKKQD